MELVADESNQREMHDNHIRVSKLDPQDALKTIERYLVEFEDITAITQVVVELTKEVERLLTFMRSSCEQEFLRHFIAQGWLATRTPKMVEV